MLKDKNNFVRKKSIHINNSFNIDGDREILYKINNKNKIKEMRGMRKNFREEKYSFLVAKNQGFCELFSEIKTSNECIFVAICPILMVLAAFESLIICASNASKIVRYSRFTTIRGKSHLHFILF